jgi:hypothetical protein
MHETLNKQVKEKFFELQKNSIKTKEQKRDEWNKFIEDKIDKSKLSVTGKKADFNIDCSKWNLPKTKFSGEFKKEINFTETQFFDNIYIEETKFLKEVKFTKAKFFNHPYFGGTKFLGDVHFDKVTFSVGAGFFGTKFLGNTFLRKQSFLVEWFLYYQNSAIK